MINFIFSYKETGEDFGIGADVLREVDEGHDSLPPNWQKHYSEREGRHYYQYSDGKRIQFSQWYYPTASEVANPAMAMEHAKQNTSEDKRKRQRND